MSGYETAFDASVRPFGLRRADLDIAFESPDHSAVVTAVLAACAGSSPEAVRAMPVSHRLALLLAVADATEPAPSLDTYGKCVADACGERVEIDLPVSALLSLVPADPQAKLTVKNTANDDVLLRLPTGEDQRRWRALGESSSVPLQIARSLVVQGDPDLIGESDLKAIGEAFEEIDGLAALRVEFECPYCGNRQMIPVDLQTTLLAKCARWQHSRLVEAHRLAKGYGWSEDEIFEIPLWRRQQYLQLLETVR